MKNMCNFKAVIKNAVMSVEIQKNSVECTTQVLEKYNIDNYIVAHIQ